MCRVPGNRQLAASQQAVSPSALYITLLLVRPCLTLTLAVFLPQLWKSYFGYAEATAAMAASLKKLQLPYVDLMLLVRQQAISVCLCVYEVEDIRSGRWDARASSRMGARYGWDWLGWGGQAVDLMLVRQQTISECLCVYVVRIVFSGRWEVRVNCWVGAGYG